MRTDKVGDAFNCGWSRGGVVNRRGGGETSGWKHVDVVCSVIVAVGYGTLIPAVSVIRS